MGPRAPRRVVVAEDEALVRLDLVEMLREHGYEVVGEAGDGETAVALAESLSPDLVILDVAMPRMDGLTAAEQITAGRHAAVIVLTAFSQRELVARAAAAGAMAYLVKPFGPADLVPAIEVAMTRHEQTLVLEGEVAGLEERLASRKVIDRAKGLLMASLGVGEPEAFRWMQKASMDRRMGMRQIAEGVIAGLGGPPGPPGAGPDHPG